MSTVQTLLETFPLPGSSRALALRRAFAPAMLGFTGAAIVFAALVSWAVWRQVPYAMESSLELHLRLGVGAAILVALFSVLRGQHKLSFYTAGENSPAKTARIWNLSFATLFVVAFLTRRADELSRGTVVLFYVSGFASLWATRTITTRVVQLAAKFRYMVAQRLLVVGTDEGISTFLRRYQPWHLGFEVVGTVSVSSVPPGTVRAPSPDFLRAIDLTRTLHIDDVYIAVPWSEVETIELCVEAFLNTPITIHLAPERVVDRFGQFTVTRVGAIASLELTRPMPPAAVALKRAVDLVGAAAGLLLLAPLFAVVALLIKLDGPGPVFFLQTRYGFNQRRFRIVKFRTMSTYADGEDVPQAARNDARVTRVGRWLRRTNIDELPQLLNVIAGQMSLVGPRPHAVPHNRAYERRIALYARRHNVRPGITGWAQVNGLRGETETAGKMEKRVEYDLFYIDNWSMLLDARILLRTVFSPRAYRNAY